ncbi:T9SS type A sorting domain-containing protein [Fulvivirga sp. M361]|uniref:T9SS type A sorting domain-containing protein n=1 Tax=Fulvivirga sp. M361 TaxID=2594266 RepID=UPI00117AA5D6|nr:T9SS type A sorting domain-containing protein [Fulvivirga sp. M361]TRX62589.1 T9SS type A sorting domain-containing protein [Fulvivirga sp. M361]
MYFKKILTLFLLSLATTLSAQEYTSRVMLGAAGAPIKANHALSGYQSIGQTGVIGLSRSHRFSLRQGFLQPNIIHSEDLDSKLTCSVYPNPFSTDVSISIEGGNKDLEVSIYDTMGKTVYADSFGSTSTLQLALSFLDIGIYVLNVQSGSKTFHSLLIKE